MTIFKSKKVKEIFENIKQEQRELNNLERLEDWEERFVDQTEQLNQTKEELENKTQEAKRIQDALNFYIEETLKKEKEAERKIKVLEEKDESKEIALLKETHQKEIRELKKETEQANWKYDFMLKSFGERGKKNKELEKELEEKELFIEELEDENSELRLGLEANLDAIKLQENWEIRKRKEVEEKLENERDLVFSFTRRLVIKEREYDKLNESYGEEHEKLRKETKKNTAKDEKIKELEWKLYLASRPLPKTPSKFKTLREKAKVKFQKLIEKTKHQSQELIARIEVKVK